MRFQASAALLLSFLIAASCAPPAEEPEPEAEEAVTTEADVEAINAVREQEIAAFTAGDIDGLLALFTDDGVVMPPNAPVAVGKEAVRSWLQDLYEQNSVQGTYTSSEVAVVGDWAFERLAFTLTLTPVAGGEPIQDVGKAVHIYQRQPDGSWKIAWDIWNSDNPPAEM